MRAIMDKIVANKRLGILIMVLVLAIIPTVSIATPINTFVADSWISKDDQESIYGKDEEDSKKKDKEEKEEEEDSSIIGDMIEDYLRGNIVTFHTMFKSLELTLGNVVMGRIDGGGTEVGGKRVALFTFEMADGNFYGMITFAIYSALRAIFIIGLACVLLVKFVSILLISDSSKAVFSFKESLKNSAVGLLSLVLLPNVLDLCIYIRDLIIYVLGHHIIGTFGLSSFEPTDVFAEIAYEDAGFVNYLIFFSSLIIVFYFMYVYITVAMSIMIHVIAFPFVCITMQFDRKALSSWVGELLSYLSVPIIDYILLLVPALFGMLVDNDSVAVALIQFLLLCGVLKGRGKFQNAIGLNSLQSEIAGIAAMLAMGRLAGSAVANVAGAVSEGKSGMKDAKESEANAQYYGDMARVDQATSATQNRESTYSFNKNNVPRGSGIAEASMGEAGGSGEFGTSEEIMLNAGNESKSDGSSGDTFGMSDSRESGIGGERGINDTVTGSLEGYRDYDSVEQPFYRQENMDPAIERARQAIADKHGTPDNVDNPMLKNMSNARKAELYQKRAKQQKAQAMGHMIGRLSGTALGAGLGMTAGAWFGPLGMAMGAAAGMNAGGAIGRYAGGLSGTLNRSPGSSASVGGSEGKESTTPNPTSANTAMVGSLAGEMPSVGVDSSGSMTPERVGESIPAGTTLESVAADMPMTTSAQGLVSEPMSTNMSGAVPAPTKSDDFAAYEKLFNQMNAERILSATKRAFVGMSSGINEPSSQIALDDAYRENKGNISYEAFRDRAAGNLSNNLADSLHSIVQSGGNVAYDTACIQKIVSDYTKNTINPVDENNQQITLPPQHILSRESLAARGYTFKK